MTTVKTWCLGSMLLVGVVLAVCSATPSLRRQAKEDSNETQEQQRRLAAEKGDLGIRFNKFGLTTSDLGIQLLTTVDYPLRRDIAKFLKLASTGVSIVTSDDFEFRKDAKMTAEEYIAQVAGGNPSMPNSDPNHPFWKEMEEIVIWQLARRDNIDPNILFRLPELWKFRNIAQVAEAVHNEYPVLRQTEFLEWLFANTEIKVDTELFPFRSNVDFLGSTIRLSYINSWAFEVVAPISFRLKWHVGRPRPEEVAYKIAVEQLTEQDGVPTDLVRKVKWMQLQSQEDFTGYPEGSPRHPSWPAMHSVGSTMSFWMRIILDLDDEQYCQALLTDYAVAMARTVAGVHYRSDNIDGLNLGQQIMAEQLAAKLANEYGSDRDKVQAKIYQERFDWRNFDPETCTRF